MIRGNELRVAKALAKRDAEYELRALSQRTEASRERILFLATVVTQRAYEQHSRTQLEQAAREVGISVAEALQAMEREV